MVQTVSAWSRNATRGAELALDYAREQAERDKATANGDQRFKAVHNKMMAKATQKAERVWKTYGIDLRNQQKNSQGQRIWTEEIKRQVVRAAYSGHWSRTEIFQAIGVYNAELRKWSDLYPEEKLPGNIAKAPSYGKGNSPLEQAIDKASTLLTPKASTSMDNITPSSLNDETPTTSKRYHSSNVTTASMKTNQQILELYGIDFSGVTHNHRGRVIPEPVKDQIIHLLDTTHLIKQHVLKDLGLSYAVVDGWRGKRTAAAAATPPAPAPSNGHSLQEPEDHAAPSPSDLAQVNSMAPQLAAGQVMKRQRRVANLSNMQEVSAVNTIKIEVTSVAHAIGILELMRTNQEITKISLSISVVD
jgi:transposase-like protein